MPLGLAVEVPSPSSRSVDLVLERELYEQADVQSSWVVDPDELTVRAWVLQDGRLVEQTVDLSEPTTLPGPVRVVCAAADLVR